MIVTSIVHAENYLFGEPGVLSSELGTATNNRLEFQSDLLSSKQSSWLLPGNSATRTTFKGGMAHIQFDSSDDSDVSGMLPVNTRLTFSMGLEENDLLSLPGSANHIDSQDWYDRYRPMLYLSIGHRW
jgi:hypothetical protein